MGLVEGGIANQLRKKFSRQSLTYKILDETGHYKLAKIYVCIAITTSSSQSAVISRQLGKSSSCTPQE